MDTTKSIRAEVIAEKLKENVVQKTMLEFELALQKQLDLDEEAVQVPTRTDSSGRVLGTKTIKRSEYVEILEKKLEDVNLKIKTLQNL